ncbi:CHC2 zinc finger domain-containing protein [Flavobacterium restrictum]|uniref:Toprim domain-containing protein n=1 Tax=Flavobacterium restrictum TaxID=2594428 RepID=A0A553DQ88_9FLAO|nr:CHC2 zinc finger domain-containing protein [Flavobacterium restrictum]TRX34916.1 toprim domain-containing protein [Flavobacterium restrictum]
MEIQDIKQNLFLTQVLENYSLQPNKNNMLRCPFHEDKTASLQINPTQNKYKCHACDKKGDVIQFVQDYEKLTKHEALKKCTAMIGTIQPIQKATPTEAKETLISSKERTAFIEKIFASFKNASSRSQPAKDYLQQRNLDLKKIEVGYNGGQFHHGQRKEDSLIQNCLAYGLLIDNNRKGNTGEIVYTVFGKYGIVFPLKNQDNQIVSLYFRNTLDKENAKHFYLKNRQGLYPNYPNPATKILILTEAIIDCASLLQIDEINENYSLLACYGTNGLNEEILKAIKNLDQLEEIIFFFDGDKAGKEAGKKYSEVLRTLQQTIKISQVETPEYEDVNSLIIGHEKEILIHLIDQRKEIIERNEAISSFCSASSLSLGSIEEKTVLKPTEDKPKPLNLENTVDFLKQNNLLQKLNILIEKSGIIGEENSRLLLFIIASSYKTKQPLHAIVQGSSGSGKTHLISKIADLMPQEDVLRFTRITESSLYNWGEYDLVNKLLIIEDLDGLKEEAMFAMRELISNQRLSSSVSVKDKKGNIKSVKKEVKGVFSSLSATTKGDLYEDNMSRSFLLAVDESQDQTDKIINYQNKRIAGEINEKEQEKAKIQLQQIMRILQNEEVQNPFATQIQLPENVHKKRRLNEMFQSIIKQITILNQFQRTSNNGKIQTEIQDVENAVEILFESIILKIDELDGSLRQFFEKLKKKFKTDDFTRFEAMETTGFKKTQLQHYINQLVQLEYIKQFGHGNKGFKYKISYFDDIQSVRKKLKEHFTKQIQNLKPNTNGNQTNTKRTLEMS